MSDEQRLADNHLIEEKNGDLTIFRSAVSVKYSKGLFTVQSLEEGRDIHISYDEALAIKTIFDVLDKVITVGDSPE